MHPIVETYQINPEDYAPTEVELESYEKHIAEKKAGKEAEPSMDANACRMKRKIQSYASKGFTWATRIIDSETSEVLYLSPVLFKKRHYADRNGQRLIKRWRKTGSFEKPENPTFSPVKK